MYNAFFVYWITHLLMSNPEIQLELGPRLNWSSWSFMTSVKHWWLLLPPYSDLLENRIGQYRSPLFQVPSNITNSFYSFLFFSFMLFLMRTFKFYSLGKFQLYSTVLSTVVTMFYITSSDLTPLFILQLKVCTLLSTSPYFPHSPSPGNHFSTLCLYVFFVLLLDSIYKW